jgi:hypothetical protein
VFSVFVGSDYWRDVLWLIDQFRFRYLSFDRISFCSIDFFVGMMEGVLQISA